MANETVVAKDGVGDESRSTVAADDGAFDADDRAGDDDDSIEDDKEEEKKEGEEEEKTEEEAKTTSSYYGLHWPFPSASSKGPVGDTDEDETPYEHNFAPGDHIIRWDMLPIIWPIQIHGIVLEVSEDRSEVTICDFGMTSMKTKDDAKPHRRQDLKILEEENAKFSKAIQDECVGANNGEQSELLLGLTTKWEHITEKKTKKQRLNVIKLTKWSDLRKWSKVNYEGGLLSGKGGGGIGKGLENLGRHTEKGLENLGRHTEQGLENLGKHTGKLWMSIVKPFARDAVVKKGDKKAWRSVRYDVGDDGFCINHNEIQLKKQTDDGQWILVRKKCPECIKEDCPSMLGEESSTTKVPPVEQASSFSSSEGEQSLLESKSLAEVEVSEEHSTDAPITPVELKLGESSSGDSKVEICDGDGGGGASPDFAANEPETMVVEPKTLSQMVADANEIEKRSRDSSRSPERKPTVAKRNSWQGSLVKSLTGIFPKKKEADHPTESTTNLISTADEMHVELGEFGQGATNRLKSIPRSDPPLLVLARTRFILEHGESILPPYHILNSNSECIAVWCKTGRWSTFQASVFLHSSAIGYGKSCIGLTIGAAATQPWLIPAFATVGVAAVGTPWLLLKVANDKWNEATNNLTEQFWMQAEPPVFVECIRKWSNLE